MLSWVAGPYRIVLVSEELKNTNYKDETVIKCHLPEAVKRFWVGNAMYDPVLVGVEGHHRKQSAGSEHATTILRWTI